MTEPIRAGMDKAPQEVAAMFDDVAQRYDMTNTVLSMGQDRLWRKAVLAGVDPRDGERILDLAAGTGASTQSLAASGAHVIACDFSLGMLRAGRAARPELNFVAGDATALLLVPCGGVELVEPVPGPVSSHEGAGAITASGFSHSYTVPEPGCTEPGATT